MKTSRFTDSQIMAILYNQGDANNFDSIIQEPSRSPSGRHFVFAHAHFIFI